MEIIITFAKNFISALGLFFVIFTVCMVATAGVVAGYAWGKRKFLDKK